MLLQRTGLQKCSSHREDKSYKTEPTQRNKNTCAAFHNENDLFET